MSDPKWMVETNRRLHDLVDLLIAERIHTGATITINHGMEGGWIGSFDQIGGETVCWYVWPWTSDEPPRRTTRPPRPPWAQDTLGGTR